MTFASMILKGLKLVAASGARRFAPRGLKLAALAFALSLAVALSAAHAAPPSNDAFAAALLVSGQSWAAGGSNVEATSENGEPRHANSPPSHSLWYRWAPPFSGTAVIDTCGSAFDTVVAVYAGSAVDALSAVAADDDTCDEQSAVAFPVAEGTTYHVAVDGFEGEVGTFSVRGRQLFPPANDALSAPQRLEGAAGEVQAMNIGASMESGEPSHGSPSSGASVWYVWAPPFSGTATIRTCDSDIDSTLAVYTGTDLGGLRLVAADNAFCAGGQVRILVSAGTDYRIAVAGVDGDQGFLELTWSLALRPANDEFARARPIAGMRGAVTGTNVGALTQTGEPRHVDSRFSPYASMWYRWRAPRTAPIAFETCGAEFDTVLAVYGGTTLRRAVRVDANDDACYRLGESGSGTASRLAFFAKGGVTYRIAVDGYRSIGAFPLRWSPPRPFLTPCVVPDVRGKTVRAAKRALEEADCRLGRAHEVQSLTVARGRIVSQRPAPSSKSRRFGTRVDVDVSRGRR